jgi:hypothetical protein
MTSMYFRIAILASAASMLLASCAPRHPKDVGQIDNLRAEAERLVKAQALMGFNAWAYGTPSNQDSLYRQHEALFTKETIELARRTEGDETDPVQKKRFTYFRRYLTSEYIARHTAPLTDLVSNMEAAATVTVNGTSVPYRNLGGLISNERDQTKREVLYRAADPVLDSLNMVLARVEETTKRLAGELGYSSYTAMVEDLKGYSLTGLKPMAEEVLTSTDSLYHGLLKEMLASELKLVPGSFHRFDVAPLFRNPKFDRYFPSASMIDAVGATYKGLGIDLKAEQNLKIDAEDRPEKNPRAVCFALSVPDDIRLSIKPIGGVDDYAALFHEMGHAQHYANTKEHAFEFKYTGEPTVTESFAFLSEYLLANQAWLRLNSRMPASVLKEYERMAAFQRLYMVRRYCAKVLYELQLHGGVANAPSTYAQLQARASGYISDPSDEKRYLIDVDPLYYAASYVRAWFLEAQMNGRLSAAYGTNWFENPDAGKMLLDLWAHGDRLNGDELATVLDVGQIAPEAWLAEVKSMVLFSTR